MTHGPSEIKLGSEFRYEFIEMVTDRESRIEEV